MAGAESRVASVTNQKAVTTCRPVHTTVARCSCTVRARRANPAALTTRHARSLEGDLGRGERRWDSDSDGDADGGSRHGNQLPMRSTERNPLTSRKRPARAGAYPRTPATQVTSGHGFVG
jgi:hypothetical protein